MLKMRIMVLIPLRFLWGSNKVRNVRSSEHHSEQDPAGAVLWGLDWQVGIEEERVGVVG